MSPPEYETVFALLQGYTKRRPRRGPFPLESALTWSILLGIQSGNNIHGDMLEIGVEFGTSAFLMLEFLSSEEQATFVDLNTTQEWLEGINGPYQHIRNHRYIVGNTLKMRPSELPEQCRWIHIDGGHLYQHVANDLQLTADSLAPDGIAVLDDFFEIRWPDVTAAILDFLREDDRLTPFLLVNRKLYCAANAETAEKYTSAFNAFLTNYARDIGHVRCWEDVALAEQRVMVAKMDLCERLISLETPD